MRNSTLAEGRFTKFTKADVARTVEIKNGTVKLSGVEQTVQWGTARHADCDGTIDSVEAKVNGKVKLVNGAEFENPAITCVSDLTTGALVYGWIKDPAVTGTDRLADCDEENNLPER